MKYRVEERRIGALRRTLESIEGYEAHIRSLDLQITDLQLEVRGHKTPGRNDLIRKLEKHRDYAADKIIKALVCVQNLEAKGAKWPPTGDKEVQS